MRPLRLRVPAQRDPRQILRRGRAREGTGWLQVGSDQRARAIRTSAFPLQLYLEDCTGCGTCVEVCPAHSAREPGVKAINLGEKAPILAQERESIDFFEALPMNDRSRVDFANVRGVQFLEPLFEFSGACAGCGETPYLKLLSQLFGDRLQIANATGCSSIYGGNLPVTPWTKDAGGRGPAWANSLFEDNAEFGLGFRLAADQHLELATTLLRRAGAQVGGRVGSLDPRCAPGARVELRAQRAASRCSSRSSRPWTRSSRAALSVVDHLIRRSIWAVGGDGWAYDIGYGGLDHVLGERPRRQRARARHRCLFQHRGPGLQGDSARRSGQVRCRRKARGAQGSGSASDRVRQCLRRTGRDGREPAAHPARVPRGGAYPGPSLILAYSHCIAHGFDLRQGMKQQDLAAASGHWPLFRFNPAMRTAGERPFRLDSPRPTIPFKHYAYNELRFRALAHTDPPRC